MFPPTLSPAPVQETLFISDLHLSPERPGTIRLFLDFLHQRAPRAERLYILGDLFDSWIGDDDDAPPHPQIIRGLKDLAESGTEVYLQRGNRDFLLGKRFARAGDCEILPDPVVVDLYGTPTLLMHGDLLCSDDLPYQKFRKKARNPLFQKLFLWRSLRYRRRIAADYRRRSAAATAEKTLDVMDVNPTTVATYMRRAGVRRLIHGHTHRPARHDVDLDGATATRWVLAQWHEDRAQALVVTREGITVEDLTRADTEAH